MSQEVDKWQFNLTRCLCVFHDTAASQPNVAAKSLNVATLQAHLRNLALVRAIANNGPLGRLFQIKMDRQIDW